jgi:PKD repeat protein
VVVTLLLAVPVPAAAGDRLSGGGGSRPAAAGRVEPPQDPLSNMELLSQDLTVWLYPENRSISVEGALRLRANFVLSKVYLYLYQTLDLLEIAEGGTPLSYTRTGDLLTITLASQLAANDTTNLSFHYSGTMWYTENGERQDCVGWEGAYLKGSTFWYLRHHASDWFDCRLKLCCPPNWTAVADGDLVAEEHSAEWSNYTWVNDLPCLRPAFAAGNYTVSSKYCGGTNVSVYTYPEDAGVGAGYLDEAGRILDYYSGILGSYGRRSFKVVETAQQTMEGYACSGFVMLYPDAFKQDGWSYDLLAHEAGHEWFPFATGYQGWAYAWLWEAFPEYLSCIYEIESHGSRARLDKDYDAYVAVHGSPDLRCIRASDWDTPYSYQTLYAKGAWVLRMLEGLVGTAGFKAILRDYIDENLWGYGSAQAFLATAAKHSPIDLDAFWEQWLNTTRALDVSLPAARQYENGTAFRLELEPANLLNGSNPADIRIDYTDDTFVELKRGWDGLAKVVALDVGASVRQVRLDPEGWLLDVDRNDQAAVPLRSGELYELRPGPVHCSGNLTTGVETSITADIYNDGQYDARGVAVDFIMDGCRTARKLVDVSSQSWALANASWTPGTEGHRTITVSVDPVNGFHEWNEGNNNASAEVVVAPLPPMLDIWCGNLTVDPPSPMEGERVWLSATVRNPGEVAVPHFNVTFQLDSQMLATGAVSSLQPGEEHRIIQIWTATRNVHTILAVADLEGVLNDADRSNNHANISFFVGWDIGLKATCTQAVPLTFDRVTFTARGDAEEFSFDFGDGTVSEWSTNRTATHEYRKGGNYTVHVGARAAGVLSADCTLNVPVQNRIPEINIWVNGQDALSLTRISFRAYCFDLDGNVVRTEWNFGDGFSCQTADAVHYYDHPGRYAAIFTATDDLGALNRTSVNLTVGNRPPVCSWSLRQQCRPGKALEFSAVVSDLDGAVTRTVWDFGDGTNSSGPVVGHVYTRAGRYNVIFHAWDDLGAEATFPGTVIVMSEETAPAEFPSGPVLAGAITIMTAGVALYLFRRRSVSKQEEDFFRPPPRDGQNP